MIYCTDNARYVMYEVNPTSQDLFLEMGFNGGKPIDEEFFKKKIAGRQNAIICADLFPEWDSQKAEEWSAFKEAKFRERAAGKLQAMPGLERFMEWIDKNNLKKAAVTNAPRANAEFMLQVIKRRSAGLPPSLVPMQEMTPLPRQVLVHGADHRCVLIPLMCSRRACLCMADGCKDGGSWPASAAGQGQARIRPPSPAPIRICVRLSTRVVSRTSGRKGDETALRRTPPFAPLRAA